MEKHLLEILERIKRNTNYEKTKNIYKSNDNNKYILKGLSGSYIELLIYNLYNDNIKPNLILLPDKEEAIYFYNNIENISKEINCFFFPASYKHPYEIENVENANVIQRSEILKKLNENIKNNRNVILVTYPEALLEKVLIQKVWVKHTKTISKGDKIRMNEIEKYLYDEGFENVNSVYDVGQFAIRGGIIDVFSYSNELPYRIEFFDDEVESIRIFNISDQLSIKKVNEIQIITNTSGKIIEEGRASLINYFDNNLNVWVNSYKKIKDKIKRGYEKAEFAYQKLNNNSIHSKPSEIYTSEDELDEILLSKKIFEFGEDIYFKHIDELIYFTQNQPMFNKDFDKLALDFQESVDEDYTNYVVSNSEKQLLRLKEIFQSLNTNIEFKAVNISISSGFIDDEAKMKVYTDHQIFERYYKFNYKEKYNKNKAHLTINEINNLQSGDYVVHIDHGIGVFSGLETLDLNGRKQENIRLIYHGGDLLYVPIHSLYKISKFSSKDSSRPKVNQLGTNTWSQLKSKTKVSIKKAAFDILELYAKRKLQKGYSFAPDNYLQLELEANFMYEETPDQIKAINAVKKDMELPIPMDRLICGDVGFGKTEVAIRAAFKAVNEGKQVAVLVPTTVLCFQHYKSFKERLKNFACNVEYINRYRNTQTNKQVQKNLTEGKVDIIIGTHKLVSKDIKFNDLGLLIIDEEHKFGVNTKDKIKTIKNNVDTLTLTATPIPRTLQFSLMGSRDMSIIKTPPPNRQPIETKLITFDEEIIRDAIIYELNRNGQVFFINNRIENIKEIAGIIQTLFPDIKIGIIHGQLEGAVIEDNMMNFINGMYDVIVATTIIESGIDVPNANTMIINNAQNFGLSDLHQMRGRIGRSNRKAFCYLITPPLIAMSTEARKRIEAIEKYSDLGSGFHIAMRDLDLRGAGDILGVDQSGFVNLIGINTYQKLLNETMNELKKNQFKYLFENEDENQNKFFEVDDFKLDTDLEVLIDQDYVNDVEERMDLYTKLNNVKNEEKLISFSHNLIDKYGKLPKKTHDLIELIALKIKVKELNIKKILLKNNYFKLDFIEDQNDKFFQSQKFIDIINFVQKNPKTTKMNENKGVLSIIFDNINNVDKANEIFNKMNNYSINKNNN